jgi:hypothetical protein
VPFTPPESTDPTAGFGAVTAAERVCEGQEDRKTRRRGRYPGLKRFCLLVDRRWVCVEIGVREGTYRQMVTSVR